MPEQVDGLSGIGMCVPFVALQRMETKKIQSCVDQILSMKKRNLETDTSAIEHKIDQMVYQLYGLTEDEIKIVEGETA
jgi:adenine-specific DNA-methyltransferase